MGVGNPFAKRNLALISPDSDDESTNSKHRKFRQWNLLHDATKDALLKVRKDDVIRDTLIDALLREFAELSMEL